jgi:DinB superfamily
MKAIDTIRRVMQKADEWVSSAAEDLRDAAMVQPTPRGGNHPMWVVGHLAFVEGMVPQVLFGEPNPVEHWQPLFDRGTTPTTDPSAYPPYDEVLATYRDLHAMNLARLDAIGEEGLDRRPAQVPPGFEAEMGTMAHTLLGIALHQMSHVGQLADARRASGRAPRF